MEPCPLNVPCVTPGSRVYPWQTAELISDLKWAGLRPRREENRLAIRVVVPSIHPDHKYPARLLKGD